MYGLLLAISTLFLAFCCFVLRPIIVYFFDEKGLRRYPNFSLFSGITNIPFMVEATKGFRSHRLLQLHESIPVLRIGTNHLSYSKVEAIKVSVTMLYWGRKGFADATYAKDIYGHGTKCIKDDFYVLMSGTHFHLADVPDKFEHQRKRKILSSAYAIKNLEGWEYKITDKVERLIRQFDSRCTTPLKDGQIPAKEDLTVDYRAWTNFFTMDAIVDIGLSQSTGFLDQGDDQTISEALDGTTTVVGYRDVLHSNLKAQSHLVWSYGWFPLLCRWSRKVSKTYAELLGKGPYYDGIVLHQARERFKRYAAREKLDDFFQALMEDKNGSPHMLEWGEIVAEISIMRRCTLHQGLMLPQLQPLTLPLLVNAGSVSTAIGINNTMYMLLKHPRCLSKLREEIDSVADENEIVIPYEKVKYLPYLRACIDEAMRIYPPTTFNLPRKTPQEGCSILGQFVPGNTSVSMSSYVAHRDTAIFPEPEVFRPERWLGDEGKQLQPYYITFSAGARGCIGRNISYLEQTILTASVLHRYDFALAYPAWEQTRYEHFNLVPGPLPLKLWRRGKSERCE